MFEPQHPPSMQKLPSRIAPKITNCIPTAGSMKVLLYYIIGLPKNNSATGCFFLWKRRKGNFLRFQKAIKSTRNEDFAERPQLAAPPTPLIAPRWAISILSYLKDAKRILLNDRFYNWKTEANEHRRLCERG
jgi:hypothetical protein